MSEHTKGPWFVDGVDILPVAGHPLDSICTMSSGQGDELYANARLISASPDLLESARAVCDAWGKFINSFDYVPGIGDMAENIEFQEMMRLRIAINKATIIQ
jgi:hypothetical protein